MSGITNRVALLLTGLFLCLSGCTEKGPSLRVMIVDEQDKSTTVRVRLLNQQGEPVASPEDALTAPASALGIPETAVAVLYGSQDRAEGFSLQPDGSFYVDGRFDLDLPSGTYTIELSKGYEYLRVKDELKLEKNGSLSKTYKLQRWINMPEKGWYSADDHIHLRRSPREDALILKWIAAEDIHVGHLLQMGDFWSTYFSQYGWGEDGRYQEGRHILSSGQEEPRTPEIGHTISLIADDFVRFQNDYYLYDKVFDRVHELGGLSGYAHQGMSFNGHRGLTLDVTTHKIDFLELLQFCVEGGPLILDHYYHFLDLGFPLTATAGSDFPWCGKGPRFGLPEGCSQIGDARFYTLVDGDFSFSTWEEGLRAGRTFVTSGPMLSLTVDGAGPGEVLEMNKGDVLKISAVAQGQRSQVPLSLIELVVHGEVLASATASEESHKDQLEVELELPLEHGLWIAARCQAGPGQTAHTTPVYVEVEGGGFHNPKTARDRLELSARYLDEIENELENPGTALDNQLSRYRDRVLERVKQVRLRLQELQTEFGVK
jgi:hypothetical protein